MNNNNDNIAKLIKEGRYKDVIKYLETDNIIDNIVDPDSSININQKEDEQSFISDYNEANLERLGYDKDLIERLQNLNKINKELLLHKDYAESDLDKTVYLLDNFNELEISDFSKLDKDFNEGKAGQDGKMNESKLNESSANKDEDSFDCVNVEKINFDEKGDRVRTQDNVKEIMLNLEKLLKEDEENAYKIMQLNENISMQNEEIYGDYFRTIERTKRFAYKDIKMKKFSNLFSSSKLFTKEFSHISIKSGIKQYGENSYPNLIENHNIEGDKIEIDFADFSDFDLDKAEVIKEIKIDQSKSKNHQSIYDFIEIGKKSKVKELFEKITSSNFSSKSNILAKNSNFLKIDDSPMQKIYNNFVKNRDGIYFSNSNEEKSEITIHPIHLNFRPNSNLEQIPTEKETLKLFDKIKVWNKNFSADDSKDLNNPSEINLSSFNNFFINSFTKPTKLNTQSDFNKLSNSNDLNQIKSENLLEINLNSKNLTIINSNFFLNYDNLISISLEDNHLTKIENFQSCKNLITLNLNKNKISKIENLSQNINLEKLFLNGNQIQKIENLHLNKKLKSLSLGRNKINSIAEVEIQIPFIEELTLCENLIKNIPEEFSLPFLKYFDLNDNKISFLNFFLCPNLEKLFLKDNKVKLFSFSDVNFNISNSLKFCPKLKELDFSFNKIENFSDMLTYIQYNKNLEVLNLNNNPFSINLKGIVKIEKMLIKIFPKLKTIDNEITRKDLDKFFENSKSNVNKIENSKICNLFVSFFNMFNIQHQFMKYFNSVYHVNNIYNRFNFNSNSSEKLSLKFLNLINENYFLSKQSHLKFLSEFLKDPNVNRNFLPNRNVFIQNTLMKYLYSFKHRFEYFLNSLQFFQILMKKKKIKKIKKLQRYFRDYKYSKNLKEKLKNVDFEYEEEEPNDDLLNFFNSREKLRSGKEKKFENIFEENNINSEEFFFRKIDNKIEENEEYYLDQAEKVEMNNEKINFDTLKQSFADEKFEKNIEISCENSTQIKFSAERIKDSEINHNHSNNKNNLEDKIKNLQKKIKFGENNFQSNINSYINPIEGNLQNISNNKLSVRQKAHHNNKIDTVNIVNALDCAEFPKISYLPNVNSLQSQLIKKLQNEEILKKNSKKENIILPAISLTPLNLKKSLPIVNEISMQQSNESISIKSYSKVASSIQADNTHEHYKKLSGNKNTFLPTKLQEQVKLIEQECKTAIKNAKEEWNFHNTQTEELLCNKIRKKYKKKIEKLIQGIN